jgi:small subunit ribosomal protein S9
MPRKVKSDTYTYAVGRRKAAVATVKLYAKSGDSTVNKIALSKFFPGATAKIKYGMPMVKLSLEGKYSFDAKVVGGGKNGQLDALVLAISRAFQKIDTLAYTPILRAAGLLTVDSRVRERRMVGTGGKARRQKQSPKR